MYKVVREVDGKLMSAMVFNIPGWAKEYSTEKHTDFGLCFDTLENAQRYFDKERGGDLQLWKCEARNPYPMKELALRFDPEDYGKFWRNPESVHTMPAPKGTVFCAHILLIERID